MIRYNNILIRKGIWDMYNVFKILADIDKKYKLLELTRNVLEHEFKNRIIPTEFKKSLKRMRYCISMSKYHIYKGNFETAIKFNKKITEDIKIIHDIFTDWAIYRIMKCDKEED